MTIVVLIKVWCLADLSPISSSHFIDITYSKWWISLNLLVTPSFLSFNMNYALLKMHKYILYIVFDLYIITIALNVFPFFF